MNAHYNLMHLNLTNYAIRRQTVSYCPWLEAGALNRLLAGFQLYIITFDSFDHICPTYLL